MNPFIRSICCSAAVIALAACGGKNQGVGNGSENRSEGTAVANAAGPATSQAPTTDPNEKRMVIEALPVSQSGPGALVGAVRMVRSSSGIETDGLGGGCLVFEDPASKTCHADSDCKVPSYVSQSGGPWAYCADSKCWVKPADKAFCWKSRYSTPAQAMQVGKAESTPKVVIASLPSQLLQGPGKNQVKARVIACLNGKVGALDVPPCAGGDGKRSDSIGQAKTFTK
jgi:hypothetical protein